MKSESVTHYALGELRGTEREEFEKALAASPRLQADLEETNRLFATLERSLPGEDALGDECRRDLLAACSRTVHEVRRRKRIRTVAFAGSLTALAACLLAMPYLPWFAMPRPAVISEPDFKGAESSFLAVEARPAIDPGPSPEGPALARPDIVAPGLVPAESPMVASSTGVTMSVTRSFTGGWGKSAPGAGEAMNTESYDAVVGNRFLKAAQNPLSTFSIDVDTASYSNVRRFLTRNSLPPEGAVRLEELVNYFPYKNVPPANGVPVSVTIDAAKCPWAPAHDLVRISLQARDLPQTQRPPSNLVFLIDVSGSMNSPDKLPLLKRSLRTMVEHLRPEDSVAIVVYAGASGLVLPPTPGTAKDKIIDAIEQLEPDGSTNGAAGIQLAYETARKSFLPDGNNRVILCTDGDFNVGVTDQSSLVELIERERRSGVFLSVLGFGTGNLKDSTMEKLAANGNGNYAYIDSPAEGRKVLVNQMAGTLFTVAKDVKVQVEFNPARVAAYRLIGYENRLLAKEDFNDDRKDAGEMGAGHSVTVLYEIVPSGQPVPGAPAVDPLKYQTPAPAPSSSSSDLFTVKIRYKDPDGTESRLIETPFAPKEIPALDEAPEDFRFAAAVAGFGQKLRGDENVRTWDWDSIRRTARGALGPDPGALRAEFIDLVDKAAGLQE